MKIVRPEKSFYKIERLVGQGRTATVYRARREDSRGHSSQTVALKVLKDQTSVQWLRQEFERLSAIRSRYCVRVLAWENLDRESALVLEWVDGLTLLELARRVNLRADLVDEIVAQVQEGLRDLALSGLFHGDLSPVNILVDRSGQVRVVDFGGIPRDRDSVTGTPEYMAPELWDGHGPGFESDLFALGLINLDLRTSFRRMAEAKRMGVLASEYFECDSSPLLHRNPMCRSMLQLSPCLIRQKELARVVCEISDQPRDFITQTMAQARRRAIDGARALASFALIAFTAAAPVAAQAPSRDELSGKTACLKIRTLNWVWLSLNGREVGYGPIEVSQLQPGRHRLAWRTRASSGEIRFELRAGPCLKFSDANFLGARQ
jgi:serine/threonine protein kinase